MRAEVAGRIDLTATASGENHTGRRVGWSLWTSVHALIAHLTFWLVSIPCKLRRRQPCSASASSAPRMGHAFTGAQPSQAAVMATSVFSMP